MSDESDAAIHAALMDEEQNCVANIYRLREVADFPLGVALQMAYSVGLGAGLGIGIGDVAAARMLREWMDRVVLAGNPEAIIARDAMSERWLKVLR